MVDAERQGSPLKDFKQSKGIQYTMLMTDAVFPTSLVSPKEYIYHPLHSERKQEQARGRPINKEKDPLTRKVDTYPLFRFLLRQSSAMPSLVFSQ